MRNLLLEVVMIYKGTILHHSSLNLISRVVVTAHAASPTSQVVCLFV